VVPSALQGSHCARWYLARYLCCLFRLSQTIAELTDDKVQFCIFCISFSRRVCRCFCSRLSERFLRARRDLVATTTKMHVDWFIMLVVSSRLQKPRSAKSYFYQKASFALVLIVSWRWVLVVFVIYAVSFEASALACSSARRYGFVSFVAVGSAQFFHCSLEVVYFL